MIKRRKDVTISQTNRSELKAEINLSNLGDFFSFVGQDKCTSDRATRCFFLCEMISNQINTWACANGKEIFCRFGWRLVAKARRTENQFCTVGEKGEEEMKDFSLTIRSQSDQLWIASWTN